MSTTALKIITKAMQKLGVLTKTELPDADEANDALDALNDMLASWSNDSMMISARVWENFTLTGGKTLYTMGTGGDFNTARPVFIADAYVRNGSTDTGINIVSDEIYALNIPFKVAPGLPDTLNCDNAYPLANIRLYPVPSSSYVLFLQSEKVLSQFTLNQTVDLAPGWNRALINNLAVDLAGDYNQPVPESTARVAMESKGAIQRAIMKARSFDANERQAIAGNIYSGYNR